MSDTVIWKVRAEIVLAVPAKGMDQALDRAVFTLRDRMAGSQVQLTTVVTDSEDIYPWYTQKNDKEEGEE